MDAGPVYRVRDVVLKGHDRTRRSFMRSRLTLERFSITRHALVGVQLATDAVLDLRDGEVAENPIGANVQVLDYPVDRLIDRVSYRNNGVNLQGERLELPPATPPTSTP